MVDAALISAADDGDLEAVERYFTLLDVLENVAVCNAIHRRHRHGEPSPTDDMDDDFDPWYWSGRGDLFVAYIVPRGQVDVFRWFFAREQRELCEETLRGLAKGIVRSCIEIGGFLTVCEMIEIVFESPLFDETMDEDERHGLLRVMMRYVVKFGCVKWVDMLLAYGADPSCAWELEPPLTEIGDQQSAKTLEALHAHGAWMEGCRLSMVRTDYAATDLVADLLRSGADANAEQPNEQSILYEVVGQRRYHTAQLLIEEGFADVDVRDDEGRTPLMVAAAVAKQAFGPTPSEDVSKLLLDAGASLQAVGGWNPDCLRLFLERGANPNVQDIRRSTPLTTLVIRSRCNIHGNLKEMLTLLLQAGADPFVSDTNGYFVAQLLQRSETGLAFMHENAVFFIRHDPQNDSEQ